MKVVQKSAILDYLSNGSRYLNSDSFVGFLMSNNIGFDTLITSLSLFSKKLQKIGKNSAILDYFGNRLRYSNFDFRNGFLMSKYIKIDIFITSMALPSPTLRVRVRPKIK